MSISGDGKTLAIGVPGYDLPQGGGSDTDEGAVFIYSKQGNNWIKTAEIIGSIGNGKSGESISLSQDGTSLIVGEPNVPTDVSEISGRAVVYKIEGNNWVPVGNPIELIYNPDNPDNNPARGGGTSVSISANGRIIAVGYPGTETDGASVRVFELGENKWEQRGPTILEDPDSGLDPNSPSSFGRTLALSADGNTLAIGLPDGEGHVDIFVYDQANDIYNHADGIQGAQGDQNSIFEGEQSDATGRVLALSDDGSSVVVSSYERNNGEGAVGVYSLERDETSPQLLRAVLSKDHKSIILEFDESLEHSYTEKDQFTVDADNINGVAIDSVEIIGPFDSRVEISLVNSITDPNSVRLVMMTRR